MLKIAAQYVQQAQAATDLTELFPLFQNAIELEHGTIPPYLTALFSFKPDTEQATRGVIHSIVIEEMLHMAIAANILNAIGGSPDIDKAAFVPNYPTTLPMGIGSGLIVGLEPYSKELVEKVFMEIEEPEHPLVLEAVALALPTYKTIGAFYQALQEKLRDLAPDTLPGDTTKQVISGFFSTDVLFPILTKTDAIRAIGIIVEQGEGTTTLPVDADGEVAHYYRFQELIKGHVLIKDPTAPHGYSFTGDPILFDPGNVLPLYPNTKAALLPEASEERRLADEFNTSYKTLLQGLHRTFNGEPEKLSDTFGVMFDLRLTAQKLGNMPFPGKPGYTVGPTYELF